MRAETLHQITKSLLTDSEKIDYLGQLENLKSAVERRLSEPGQPAHDEAIRDQISSLLESLKGSVTREFPLSWQEICREHSLECLLAQTIEQSIDLAFKSSRLDSELKSRLDAMSSEINEKLDALREIEAGFATINLKDDTLGPRQYELNIALPRDSIDDRLSGFGNELNKLNKEFQVLSSIVNGEKQELFKIKSISSNDFSVVLNIDLNLTAVLTFVFLSIQILLRKIKSDTDYLEKISTNIFSKKLIVQIKQEIDNSINAGLDTILANLDKECPDSIDEKQLKNKKETLRGTLMTLVERLRKEQFMDVRAGPAQGDNEDEDKIKGGCPR